MKAEQPDWRERFQRWRRRAPDSRWLLLALGGAVLCLPRLVVLGAWLLRAEPGAWLATADWIWAGQLALQGLFYPGNAWFQLSKELTIHRGGGPAELDRDLLSLLRGVGSWASLLLLLNNHVGAAAAVGYACVAPGCFREAVRRDHLGATCGIANLAVAGALLARSIPAVVASLLLLQILRGGWFRGAARSTRLLPVAEHYLAYYRRRAVPGAHWMIVVEYAQAACLVGAFQEAERARNGYVGPLGSGHLPGSLGARIALGRGDYSAAARLAGQSPLLALAHAGLGDRERAFRIAREAISRRRDDAHAVMAQLLRQDGDLNGSLRHSEEAVRGPSCHDRAGGFRAMAELHRLRQDWSRAAWCYEQALRYSNYLVPEDGWGLVECLRMLGRERRATPIARALERRGPPSSGGEA